MPLSFSNKVKNTFNDIKSVAKKASPYLGSIPAGGGMASMAMANALKNKLTKQFSAPVQQPMIGPVQSPTVQKTPVVTPAPTNTTGGFQAPATNNFQASAAPTYTPPALGVQTPPPKPVQEKPNFGGILFDLIKKANEGSQGVEKARADLTKFQQQAAEKIGDIRSDDIPLEFQQGRAQVVQQVAAEREKALQTGVENALSAQQQQLSALQGAAGLAQPAQVAYSSQFLDPVTGMPVGQGSTALNDQVSLIARKVQDGTLSYDAAVQALSGYGQMGVNSLQQQLPQGFNISQSNALAGQQGTVGVNYQLADTALNNVESIIGGLSKYQKTNMPAINKAANWISTQFGAGSEQTRAMTGAVASLRNAYAALLSSVKGGTPTDYSGQALAEIPNEPTPNDIKAIRKNFETLGQARQQILGNPGFAGQSGGQLGGGGNSLYSW